MVTKVAGKKYCRPKVIPFPASLANDIAAIGFGEAKNPELAAWVVARHFTVFTSSRLCACLLHRYGQHACGKVPIGAAFPRVGKVLASGNVFMEMVTDK